MRHRLLIAAASGLALLSPVSASAQAAATPPAADAATAARAVLALEEGTWDAAITFPPAEPGGQPSTARGVQVNELRSGGMWMLNRFSVDGTPYQGTGVWGFDRTTGRYTGIWVDNNDAQMRVDDGRWDAAARVMTWSADMVQTDGRHVRLLMTETFEAGGARVFRSVALTRRGEVPLVEIRFTRRG